MLETVAFLILEYILNVFCKIAAHACNPCLRLELDVDYSVFSHILCNCIHETFYANSQNMYTRNILADIDAPVFYKETRQKRPNFALSR